MGGLTFLPLELLTRTSPEISSLMSIPDTIDSSSSATDPTGVGKGANDGVGILARSICAQLFAGVGGGGGVLGDCVAVLVVIRCDKILSLTPPPMPGVALGISLGWVPTTDSRILAVRVRPWRLAGGDGSCSPRASVTGGGTIRISPLQRGWTLLPLGGGRRGLPSELAQAGGLVVNLGVAKGTNEKSR